MKIKSYNLNNYTIHGYDEDYIFSTIKNTDNFYEIEILEVWSHYFDKVNSILDVGANIGNHSIYWSQNDNIKKIVAFEPVKSIFNLLKKNIKSNNIEKVEIHKLGLGKNEGFAIINKNDSKNLGATSLSFVEDETDIKIVSGDLFLFDKNYSIDLIKIDVEGFEIDVLKGFKKTIDIEKPILWIEVNLDTLEEVLKILEYHDYRIIDVLKFNILAIHKSKVGDLKEISKGELIFRMLKNLDSSWLYRNNFLDSEKQKNQEKMKVDEFKALSEKHLSQFLYEQKKCEDLKNESGNRLSQFLYEQKKANNLKKQNNELERSLKLYKSRKIIRITDNFWKLYYFPKSILIKIFKTQKNSFKAQNEKKVVYSPKEETNILSNKKIEASKKNPRTIKELKNIKVATILDEFSYNCFKHEFYAIPIEPDNWLEKFENEKPDIFLCESAWSGIDSELRPWKGQIYASASFKSENRSILLDIIQYCKKNEIPTIFWNKEDPTHYDDKIHNFVDTALRFDHIFTTSEECVIKYKEEYGHESAHCLMFGAQPKLFNPIELKRRSDDVIFAGSWYKQHPNRCSEMKKIFDTILDSGFNLKIYNRSYHTHKDDPNRIFPDKYGEYINPPVPFDQIEKVYKESKYGLNINTVTNSETMFARRVFELMLCNTLVLSNYSKGMHKIFEDDVIFIDKNNIELSDPEKKRINNLYEVLKNHTYSERFKQILNSIKYEYLDDENTVTFYYTINDQSDIKKIIKHYESIIYEAKKLVLILSDKIPNHLIKNIYQKYANDEISVYSLNYLLNQNGTISNDSSYFVFANLQLKKEFVEKAILHYSYIQPEVGITLGDGFNFDQVKCIHNTLLTNKSFSKAFNNIFIGKTEEFNVYNIQI
ncbi:MAG: FkbM family methyltransferase [Methanobacteriaceae archaeon]|nr:FkbM family methyltransferase [Methanobacteriaceae archaeon]